jgi:hypothetical protein
LKLKLDVRMARAVGVAATVGAIGIIPAVPAMAGPSTPQATGPSRLAPATATATSSSAPRRRASLEGSETSGGYSAATPVTLTFREGSDTAQSTNNQYYFALPAAINPAKVAIHNETVAGDGDQDPATCLANATSAVSAKACPVQAAAQRPWYRSCQTPATR